MTLNHDIADIEKTDGICSITFVVEIFQDLFLHPSIFFIKNSRSAEIINVFFIRFTILTKL